MTSELDRFKTIMATIALTQPGLSLSDALLLADATEKEMSELPLSKVAPWTPNLGAQDEITRWVREQTDLRSMPKINAIKEIRSRLSVGLKEAKEAHERAFPESRF